jgi:hypothetical protein
MDTKDLYLLVLDPGLNCVALGLVCNVPPLIHHASFIIHVLVISDSLKYLESDNIFNVSTKLSFLVHTTLCFCILYEIGRIIKLRVHLDVLVIGREYTHCFSEFIL